MINLRIRCQVLKVIAAMDQGTADDVHKHLPHLTKLQIQKALYDLCEDDEIRKIGKLPRENSNGKPWNIYQIRDENIPIDTSKKKVYKKSRPTKSQQLQRPIKYDVKRGMMFIRYRDRKIKLLTKLLDRVENTDKDLLIGIINDLK